MSIVIPGENHFAQAVQRLDTAGSKLPKNPDMIGDYQKWTRFVRNPAVTILMPLPQRLQFLSEMRALKERYVR